MLQHLTGVEVRNDLAQFLPDHVNDTQRWEKLGPDTPLTARFKTGDYCHGRRRVYKNTYADSRLTFGKISL